MILNMFKKFCVIAGTIIAMASVPIAAADDAGEAPAPVLQAAETNAGWVLRLPKEEQVVYRGIVSFDSAGMGSGGMLYPAPGLEGFLAAVLTHGFIVEASKNSQKQKLQKKADKVLAPYQSIIGSYQHKDLMQRALGKLVVDGSKTVADFSAEPGGHWLIESAPVFSMTSDESAIVLDNVISVYAPGTPKTPVFQNVVRVISHPENATDLVGIRMKNDGESLKDDSASLLAESLQIAVDEVSRKAGENKNPHKTFRYFQGGTEQMERGQLVSERCNRVLLKTLRGWLMSVPSRKSTADAVDGSCILASSNIK
jgi:hypothetical protein